jgi:membrane peptidoglycan carboxypeptidase
MKLIWWVKFILIGLGRPILYSIKLIWKILISYFFLGSILLMFSGGLIWLYINILSGLPNVNEIYNPPKLSSKILDRNGKLLYKFYDDQDRTWVPLTKIPLHLVEATIAIEDKNFLMHQGISLTGITKAIIYNLVKKEDGDNLRGGSTITQQLVKSVFFSNERTLRRKIREAILALTVERILSKDEILEKYFNQVAYGGDTYGVQEASLKYFNKNVWEISLAEAAFLAGLPAAPSAYSPGGSNPNFGFLRQKHVVSEMVSAGFITKAEEQGVNSEMVTIIPYRTTIKSPHFVFYIKDFLENKFGYDNFARRGMTVTTSLDLETQEMAEKIVQEEIAQVEKLRISNGAVVVMKPRTAEILAMVGSKNYFAKDIDGNYNVTTALRQPGSSIKPINYLLALKRGRSLASMIDDKPVVYKRPGQSKPYIPINYNGKFMGQTTLRTALASSLNIPSVKLLAENGVNDMIDLAESMGISTWKDRGRYGLSLALGSGEVKMTELANAYTTFANMGKKSEITPILRIENYLGEEIFRSEPAEVEVVEPGNAFLINSALSDNVARTPVFGPNSKLKIDKWQVAVKTGTTNNLKDNWCIGWTDEVLVAAWVGNNNATPMSWVASGVSGATPIWNRIIKEILATKQAHEWIQPPEGVYQKSVCNREEYFLNGSENSVKCPVIKVAPTPGV